MTDKCSNAFTKTIRMKSEHLLGVPFKIYDNYPRHFFLKSDESPSPSVVITAALAFLVLTFRVFVFLENTSPACVTNHASLLSIKVFYDSKDFD